MAHQQPPYPAAGRRAPRWQQALWGCRMRRGDGGCGGGCGGGGGAGARAWRPALACHCCPRTIPRCRCLRRRPAHQPRWRGPWRWQSRARRRRCRRRRQGPAWPPCRSRRCRCRRQQGPARPRRRRCRWLRCPPWRWARYPLCQGCCKWERKAGVMHMREGAGGQREAGGPCAAAAPPRAQHSRGGGNIRAVAAARLVVDCGLGRGVLLQGWGSGGQRGGHRCGWQQAGQRWPALARSPCVGSPSPRGTLAGQHGGCAAWRACWPQRTCWRHSRVHRTLASLARNGRTQ